jgi:Fe-S oxidoreductase
MFAKIHTLSRLGSLWPSMANWTLTHSTLRHALDRFVGIDSRRKLPLFAAETFESWFTKRSKSDRNGMAATDKIQNLKSEISGKVVLFHDTFINFNYPEIGKAATQILETAGYEVRIAERKCCGRPMISKGFAEAAREVADFNVRQLHPFVEDGYTVVGCEPSCILTFRDEYPDLLKGHQVADVAKASFLFEEFIVNEKQAGRWKLDFKRQQPKALVHGHCHEKALIGSRYLKEALAMAYKVEEIDSGCCGMAGSFGYEKEHYDVSIAIGRRRLFPAVENNPDAIVIAPGISCRQQVEHATGRRPLHPAEALLRAL